MGGGGRKHWGSLRKNFKYFYLMEEKSWIEREEKKEYLAHGHEEEKKRNEKWGMQGKVKICSADKRNKRREKNQVCKEMSG